MKNNLVFRKFDAKTDLNELFDLMLDSKDQILFHGRLQLNSISEFEKWFMGNLAHTYHDFYVVSNSETNEFMGYAYSYEYRQYDGHCKVCAVLKEQYRAVGLGAIVGLRILHRMFSDYPLRKIYVDIYDYNKQSLKSNIGAGFIEEGCMKNFRYANGEYYDMHILAITRERYYELHKGILNEIK